MKPTKKEAFELLLAAIDKVAGIGETKETA